MRKISNIIGIVLGLCCLVLLASPDYKKPDGSSGIFYNFAKEKTVMLNERQKKILEKENLPTVYEELNSKQRQAILACEELFGYLEETYPEEHFEYNCYFFPSKEIDQHLVADCSIGTIRVYRQKQDGKWVYLDNYELCAQVKQLTELYAKELDKEFGEGNWEMYPDITYPKEVFEHGIENRCWVSYIVYVKQGAVTDLEMSARKLADIMAEYDCYRTLDNIIRIMKDEVFEAGDLHRKSFIEYIRCEIEENRTIRFY